MLHWRPSFLLFKYISISELPYLCTFQTQLYSKWSNRCRNHWYRFAEAFNQASNVYSYYFFQILKNSFEFLNIFSFRSFKFNCVRNDLSSQSFSVSLASLCRSFQPKFVSVSVFQILNFLQFAKTFLLSISGITWAHHEIRTNFEFSSIWKMVEKRGNLGIVNLGGIASNFQNSCATKMAKLSYDSSRCIGSYQVWSSRIMAEKRVSFIEKLIGVQVVAINYRQTNATRLMIAFRATKRKMGEMKNRGCFLVSNQSFLYLS